MGAIIVCPILFYKRVGAITMCPILFYKCMGVIIVCRIPFLNKHSIIYSSFCSDHAQAGQATVVVRPF